jgi:UDP-N-acetylglucosamine 2-epimerase (non-hydrolysing)
MSLIERAHIVLTDSGGLQEEVLSFGKPILILRDVTERPDVVKAGCARLVSTSTSSIVNNTSELMSVPHIYSRMANAGNPFGDGHASERIVARLLDQKR